MKSRFVSYLFATAALIFALGLPAGLLLLLLTGCGSRPAPVRPPVIAPPNAAPVIAAQLGKDATILTESTAIDALAPAAKPHTDGIRAAIAAAPAADVAAVTAAYDATVKSYKDGSATDAKTITSLREQLAQALNSVDRLIRIGLSLAGALCIAAGILGFALSAQVAALFPGFGPRLSLGLIGAGLGLMLVSIGYGWAVAHQNLLMGLFAALFAALSGIYYANHHHVRAPAENPARREIPV